LVIFFYYFIFYRFIKGDVNKWVEINLFWGNCWMMTLFGAVEELVCGGK
jgi:hypothetical protein